MTCYEHGENEDLRDVPIGPPPPRAVALDAICEAFGEDTTSIRFTGVEPTGMSHSERLMPVQVAVLALDAIKSLPVEVRMEAMGMREYEVTDDDLRTTDGHLFWCVGADKRVWMEDERA